jgi:CDP-4-dehydro-6-deoxyglucose reductase
MLVVLALVQPVVSQGGPAHMHSAPQELALRLVPAGALSAGVRLAASAGCGLLVVGGTAAADGHALAAATAQPRAALQATLHPGPARVAVREGETLLEAGLRAGLALPYDCRAGGCGQCLCTVLHGKVDHGAFQEAALTPRCARAARP